MILFHAPIELTAVASFGPTLAALSTHRLATGNYRAFRIYTTWPRIVGASICGIALVVFAYVVLPGLTTGDPHKLNWGILASVAVYNYSTLVGGPLGEEPGWRGYALPRLEEQFGPVGATLLLALLWAAWHLPLFLVTGWTTSPLWTFVLILVGLSVIMTHAANVARFSVVTAIATHAAFNTVSRFLAGLFIHTQPSVHIPFELVLALCGLAVALVLIVMTRKPDTMELPGAEQACLFSRIAEAVLEYYRDEGVVVRIPATTRFKAALPKAHEQSNHSFG